MIHSLSLVTKMGSSFDYENNHVVNGRAILVIGGECVEIYSEVFDVKFSLHVPWSCDLLHILYFFFLYI